MRSNLWKGAAFLLGLCFLGFALHNVRYLTDWFLADGRSDSDPKSTHYLMWKKGEYRLDPDVALGTMIGDADSASIVIGKTRKELEGVFGYLTPIDQASDYDKDASRTMHPGVASDQIFVLRNSCWLVVFSNGRASQVGFAKG